MQALLYRNCKDALLLRSCRLQVVEPFVEYVRQDAEPKLLARSAAVGFFLGLCPVVGEAPSTPSLHMFYAQLEVGTDLLWLSSFHASDHEHRESI